MNEDFLCFFVFFVRDCCCFSTGKLALGASTSTPPFAFAFTSVYSIPI